MTAVEMLDDATLQAAQALEAEEAAIEAVRGSATADELERMSAGLRRIGEQRDRMRRLRAYFMPLAAAADCLRLDLGACERFAREAIARGDEFTKRAAEFIEGVASGEVTAEGGGIE